jgi:hypothetical protein
MAIINGTSIGGMTLRADYSYTQNTSAATTTITVVLQLADHYALYASAMSGSYISVGGSKTNYSKTISYGGSSTTTTELARKTVTITHNSDGTASCNISGSFVMNGTYRGYSVGTMTVNQTISLPKIARSSSFAVSSSVNTGSALSGTITPSSTAFNHKIQLKIGSTVKDTISLSSGTNTFSYTVPHSWLPNKTSDTITAVLQTYNGGSLVGTTSKNVVVNVPASVTPSVTAFTAAIAANGLSGLYVQGKTTINLTATASAGSGSSIVSYTYSGPNVSSTTTANSITTAAIQSSGTLTYTVQVRDGRGRTASRNVSISVQPYSTPSIGPVSVQRCDSSGNISQSGTYARYTVNSSYSPVGGKNTRTVTIAYSSNNGSSYSGETTLQAASDTASTKTGTYGGGAFALASTYIIRFTIKDSYGAVSQVTVPLMSAARPINIRSNGKGVAIGGMSTKDEFEVSMPADFNSRVNIDGALTVAGNINGVDVGVDNYVLGGSRDNITSENWVANAPSFIGTYSQGDLWYNTISLRHRNGQSDGTAYGMQLRSILTKQDNLSWRQNMNNSWTGWRTILDSGNTADYVVEQGTQGDWTYRKWNSGFAECWRNVSVTPGNVNGTNSIQMTLPFTFANTNYNVTITPAKAGMYVDRCGDCATNGTVTHTTTNFTMAYNYAYGTAYNVSFNVVVNGRWK